MGLSNQFRTTLEQYIWRGGTVVVFSQQRGSDFGILPTPSGRPILGYGYLEDQHCYTNGAYIDTFHPMLASQSGALVTSTRSPRNQQSSCAE